MIVFDEGALDDLAHIFTFTEEMDPDWALSQIARIRRAVLVLDEHPLIGRRVAGEIRELVISSGKTGFIALYQYEELDDLVRVLAIRHQREAGYRGR